MKKLIANTLLLLLTAFPTIAQDTSQEKSQVKADKIKPLFTAFLNEKLEITVDESIIFWAAHNELETEREAIRNKKNELRKKPNEKESLSDKELEENVIQMGDLLIQEIELNRAFILECFTILDPNRAAKIPFFERQFRERIKERRSQGNNR